MGRFALRRILQDLVVILGVTIIVFVVTRLIGDPVKVMLPVEATPEQRDAFAKTIGFDRPISLPLRDERGRYESSISLTMILASTRGSQLRRSLMP